MTTTWLTHNKVSLALHHLSEGHLGSTTRPLLLLHGLGERAASGVPAWAASWTGPVYALDFTGHGESTLPAGGGYSAEILLADADAALGAIGAATVLGRGLGAYIALLLAGARPDHVRGAVLCDGPGLVGGAIAPTSQSFHLLPPSWMPPDQYALVEMSRDLRPPDYAALFVRLAVEGSTLEEPIAVAAIVHPPWLEAVVAEVGVSACSIGEALAAFESA